MVANVSHKNLKSAKRYSKALVELALTNDGFNTEYALKLQEKLEFVVKTVEGSAELKNFILNPVVSKKDKKDVLEKIFKGSISEQILNFLFILADNSRLDILPDIFISFSDSMDNFQNIVRARVTSAIELEEAQKKMLTEKLQNKISSIKNVKIESEYDIDKSILGGLIIKIKDTVIDLSIKKKIENLKNNECER